MQTSEQDPDDAKHKDAGKEKNGGLFAGAPQIVGSPAKSFVSVFVEEKAGNQPCGEEDPEISIAGLELPHVNADKGAERKGLNQVHGAFGGNGHGCFN